MRWRRASAVVMASLHGPMKLEMVRVLPVAKNDASKSSATRIGQMERF